VGFIDSAIGSHVPPKVNSRKMNQDGDCSIMTTTKRIRYQDTFIREVRATYHPTDKRPFLISEPEEAAGFIRSVLVDNSREHFVPLFLDGAHRVASYSIVAIGTANSCQAHPREVLQRAILCGAISLIIAHNHPSGDLTPSNEDRKVTKHLREACDLIGIRFLDHLIINDSDHRSLDEC
jgi:DNA repair protein RadC